jgi:hypothetical protein
MQNYGSEISYKMAKESREEMRGWYQDITYFKEIVRDKVN